MTRPIVIYELAAAAEAVEEASGKLDATVTHRNAVIRRASEAGMSLRAIAAVVGVNHQRVAQILGREDG